MASDQLTTCRYVHMISLTKIGMFVKQVRTLTSFMHVRIGVFTC